jgi:hypothetical protein
MVPFLYPRKGKRDLRHHLPHSHAFEHSKGHRRESHLQASETDDSRTHQGPADLDTYTTNLHRWTLCQLHTSFPTVPHTRSRHSSLHTTSTIVSPLYPTNSSLYNCSIRSPRSTPGLDGAESEEEEILGDIGTTHCNTPKQRGLRRRSTVVAARRGKVKEEIADEGEGQARLRPVELRRSLSCAG